MDRQEEVGLCLVGDRRTRLERDEGVVGPRVDHLRTELVMEQSAEPQRDVENNILLLNAVNAQRAGVMAAVAGVDHNTIDLETKGANQRGLAVRSLERGCARRRGRIANGMSVRSNQSFTPLLAGLLR